MEKIKAALALAITTAHGANVLELEDKSSDLYFKLCLVDRCPNHVIYLRLPANRNSELLFHYALLDDMRACENASAEIKAWKQQNIFRLVRRCKGDFVTSACAYVCDAVRHIEQHRGISGRGFFVKVKTFAEVGAGFL